MSKIKYLLDTNIVIDLFHNNKQIVTKLRKIKPLYISSIVFGELSYGVEKAMRKEKHLKQLLEFTKLCSVIPITKATSIIYGKLKKQLKIKGKPIPENDIWIAAHAIEYNAILLSNDKHLKFVDGLLVEDII